MARLDHKMGKNLENEAPYLKLRSRVTVSAAIGQWWWEWGWSL